MSSPQAENLDRLLYVGIGLIAAGVTLTHNIGYAAIVAGGLLFFWGTVIGLHLLRGNKGGRN
jgi:hypothetical protein